MNKINYKYSSKKGQWTASIQDSEDLTSIFYKIDSAPADTKIKALENLTDYLFERWMVLVQEVEGEGP